MINLSYNEIVFTSSVLCIVLVAIALNRTWRLEVRPKSLDKLLHGALAMLAVMSFFTAVIYSNAPGRFESEADARRSQIIANQNEAIGILAVQIVCAVIIIAASSKAIRDHKKETNP